MPASSSRRTFIVAGLACGRALAQGARKARVAVFIGSPKRGDTERFPAALAAGMRQAGIAEGHDATLEVHWGGGDIGQIRAVAERIRSGGFDLVAVSTATAAREVLRVVPDKPVVFWGVSDPVGNGFIANPAHPGGHVTGFALYPYEVGGKWMQLLKEAVPGTRRAVVLMSANNPNHPGWRKSMNAAAPRLSLELAWPELRNAADVAAALQAAARSPGTGVIALADPFLSQREHVALLTAHASKLPIVSGMPAGAELGALLSYEVDQVDLARRAGVYVGRVLRGEKPGDLPVQSADKYRLVINRATERALGLRLPQSLLLQADQVLE